AARVSRAAQLSHRTAAPSAGAAFLRRHQQWLWRHVLLCRARGARRSVGDRRLCQGLAGKPGRAPRRRAGGEAERAAMSALRDIRLWAVLALLLGLAGCILGARGNFNGLLAAWLATCIFWLGVPLGAVTLLLVQDLTGGRWMGGARPALEAPAIAMPLATLAFLPLVASLPAIYRWSAGESGLTNHFYLNDGFFALRYAVDVVLWNALAAWAVLAPRAGAEGVPR